jgi:hypothetical protein
MHKSSLPGRQNSLASPGRTSWGIPVSKDDLCKADGASTNVPCPKERCACLHLEWLGVEKELWAVGTGGQAQGSGT